MGYSHTMSGHARIKPGVTPAEVEAALEPVLVYFGDEGAITANAGVHNDNTYAFDEESRDLEFQTNGEVGYGYADLVEAVAGNLHAIVSEAGQMDLIDYDSGDIENMVMTIEFGPDKASIDAYIRSREIGIGLETIRPYVGPKTLAALRGLLDGESAHE